MPVASGFFRGPKDCKSEAESHLSAREIGRRAADGAALLAAKGVFQQMLGLVSTIVVARLLVPDQLGIFALASTISALLWMIGGGQGMAGALIRRPTAPDRKDLQVYVGLQLGIMTTLAVIGTLATLPFGKVGEVTAVMLAVGPVIAFRGAGLVVIERRLLYGKLATAETTELVAYYTWTVVTVAIGWGVWGLATATVVRSIVGTAMIVWLAPAQFIWPRFNRERARGLLGLGVRVQAVELLSAVRDQVLMGVTAAIGGLAVVAFYNVILRVLQVPTMLLVALLRVSFPAMSQVQASDGDAARMLPRMLTGSAILFGALVAPLAGAAPAFVPLLLGEKWAPAGEVLPLICFAVVVYAPVLIGCQGYLWAIGDAKSPLRGMTADAVIFCAVGLPLVPYLGILGLAVGLFCANIAHAVTLARAVKRTTNVRALHAVRLPVALWTIAAGVAWICAETAGPLIVRTVVSTVVALGLYTALIVPTHRELTREMFKHVRPWFRRWPIRRDSAPAPAPTS